MLRENDAAVSRPQKEFPCWSQGKNMMSMTHKSKNKDEIILKAKIVDFLVSSVAEACLLYHREGWQLPTKAADQKLPKCQPVSHREETDLQSVDY